jgi:surface antigen/uncharacterized protein
MGMKHRAGGCWALALCVALLSAVVIPGGVAAAKTTKTGRTALLRFSISPKRYELTVRVRTKQHAVCTLRVSSHKKSATLPKLRADGSGKVTFKWGVPINAPSGKWTFSMRCLAGEKAYTLKKSATILTGGNGKDGVIQWDSLAPQSPVGKGAGSIPHVTVSVPNKQGDADPGNDYPAALLGTQDSVFDNWGELNRECTSFVAWALATRNGFNMPFYANAQDWGNIADGSEVAPNGHTYHYTVNSTPAVGSVAWEPAGHVAYVEQVAGASVRVEEYNEGYPKNPGQYDTRWVADNEFQYIHFADVGPSGVSGGPTTTTSPVTSGGPTTPSTNGQWQAAFNSGSFWTIGHDDLGDLNLGMAPGTSPSITVLSNGGWEAAFQANNGHLWVVGSDNRGDLDLGMAAGTSPSITAMPNGGWEVAFQSSSGSLWVVGQDDRGDMQLGMAAGTSPSITTLTGGGWEVAFNSGSLWIVGNDDRGDMNLGMEPGTSPSIAAMPNNGWETAFNSNNGLWIIGQDNRGEMNLGMAAGTSPSITSMTGGGWEAAFNSGSLWVIGADNRGDMNLGMAAGTNPSITSMPNNGWEAAFNSNNDLWLVGQDSRGDMQLGMAAGTSPSIAP